MLSTDLLIYEKMFLDGHYDESKEYYFAQRIDTLVYDEMFFGSIKIDLLVRILSKVTSLKFHVAKSILTAVSKYQGIHALSLLTAIKLDDLTLSEAEELLACLPSVQIFSSIFEKIRSMNINMSESLNMSETPIVDSKSSSDSLESNEYDWKSKHTSYANSLRLNRSRKCYDSFEGTVFDAALTGNFDVLSSMLLDIPHLAGLESNYSFHRTPLHMAVESGSYKCTALLLSYNVNPNCKDDYGNTPIHFITKNYDKNILECLLSFGCNVNEENINGETALVNSVVSKNLEAISDLLKYGAKPNRRLLNLTMSKRIRRMLFPG